MQGSSVQTASGNRRIPVPGDGDASDDARRDAKRSVDEEVYDHRAKDSLGSSFNEDALALEDDRELESEMGERVGGNRGKEGFGEVLCIFGVDAMTEAVFDLYTFRLILEAFSQDSISRIDSYV